MKKRLFPTALALASLLAPLLALLPSGARAACGPYEPVAETPTAEKPCEKKAGSDCPCPNEPASPDDCWGYRDGCKPTGCGTAASSPSSCCSKPKPCGGCESCEQACCPAGCCSKCVKPDGVAAMHKEVADLKRTCEELLSRIDVLTREVQASREQVLQRLNNIPLVQFSYPPQPQYPTYNQYPPPPPYGYQQVPPPAPNVVPNTTSSSSVAPSPSEAPSAPNMP